MIDMVFWLPVILAGLLAGGSTGLIGTYIVGMRIPFLGVCVSHAALAGAIFGAFFGLTGHMLILPALGGALVTALLLGVLDPDAIQLDANVLLGLFFSLTMGLAFLGLGLFDIYDMSKSEVLQLLWGSVLSCGWFDLAIMGATSILEIAFIVLFYKEMRAILFSRTHAAAAGVRVTLVWTIFLILTCLVLTVNFQTVGGLMLFSLLTNPAAAAFLLVKGYGRVLLLSTAFGMLSGVGGFFIAAATDLPAGAMIVIVSSILVGIAAAIDQLRKRFSTLRSTTVDV